MNTKSIYTVGKCLLLLLRECVKIHLMISFRHGFRGFHGKKTKKICVFRVIRA